MAALSGNYSYGSPHIQNSCSDEDLIDRKKRKRMQSNRESARRSRVRKQKHLDDLMAQIAQLKQENHQIKSTINATTQYYVNFETENTVLKAQILELSQSLQSLNEILNFRNSTTATAAATTGSYIYDAEEFQNQGFASDNVLLNNPWNNFGVNQYPVMASIEMFDY